MTWRAWKPTPIFLDGKPEGPHARGRLGQRTQYTFLSQRAASEEERLALGIEAELRYGTATPDGEDDWICPAGAAMAPRVPYPDG